MNDCSRLGGPQNDGMRQRLILSGEWSDAVRIRNCIGLILKKETAMRSATKRRSDRLSRSAPFADPYSEHFRPGLGARR